MKFICIRKNYSGGQLWRPGDQVDFDQPGAEASAVRSHFRPVDAAAASAVVKAPEVKAPVGEDSGTSDPVAPPSADAAEAPVIDEEPTNARENLKHLCLRNGINVHSRISNKAMRDALAAKGITVS